MATPITYQVWMLPRGSARFEPIQLSNHRSPIRARRIASTLNAGRLIPVSSSYTVRKS